MSPRAGHSATRLRDCIVVFGGGGINGTLNDTWTISAPPLAPPLAYSDDDRGVDDGVDNRGEGGAELQWVLPEVSGTPPSPRAYHSACGRLNYAEDGLEQLLVFGGTGAAGRLNDLHILHFPSMHWTSPRCDESGGAAADAALLAHLRRHLPRRLNCLRDGRLRWRRRQRTRTSRRLFAAAADER